MGSYLSNPITTKIPTDEANDKLAFGASSMQGWRVNQEEVGNADLAGEMTTDALRKDAHNSILDFDENTSFFAVYDGHGGHEVAQYCSQKLPQFIKDTEAYKNGDIEQALIEGFLQFDASIATQEVITVLKDMAGLKEAEEASDDEEDINNLYEEASMPIEKVIANLVNPDLKKVKSGNSLPRSPMIIAKKDKQVASSSSEAGGSMKDAEVGSSSSEVVDSEPSASDSSKNNVISSSNEVNGDVSKDEESTPAQNKSSIPQIKISSVDSPESAEAKGSAHEVKNGDEKKENILQNGDVSSEEKNDKEDNVTSSVDGELSNSKGKGKSPMKKVVKIRPKRNAAQLYKKILDFQEDSEEDSEDEEDKTFEGPGEESSDEEGANVSIEENEASEEESSDADADAEEEDDDEIDEEDEDDLEFARNMKEEPGSDSGCTAVVALLKERELYVANAGDSRCVVCRNGKAIDMSFDHKPEDEPERSRIVKAGGKVTGDGRVNGGLNLSRAIGDHAYKQNKKLGDKEQMITALPDIKKITINPSEDEFMVLACDGIWNSMSSQEVVDFVKPRLTENPDKISTICGELFDNCLAPHTMGDGTGCDNMTAIIVKFQPNLKKRAMSPEPAVTDSKRAKTEEDPLAIAETSQASS